MVLILSIATIPWRSVKSFFLQGVSGANGDYIKADQSSICDADKVMQEPSQLTINVLCLKSYHGVVVVTKEIFCFALLL